jgi:hypothetical protein
MFRARLPMLNTNPTYEPTSHSQPWALNSHTCTHYYIHTDMGGLFHLNVENTRFVSVTSCIQNRIHDADLV